MLAALASLTQNERLFKRVVPPSQSFDAGHYNGMFHFNFWQNGEWTPVVIDDRLPTTKDGRLLYLSSASGDEFWSALLEKAYAKLCGGYKALQGGSFGEAISDFTGGVPELIDLQSEQRAGDLYDLMSEATWRGCLMGCSILTCKDNNGPTGQTLTNNLVQNHGYSITGFSKPNRLVRLRNTWGDLEWNGAWADGVKIVFLAEFLAESLNKLDNR